MIHHVTRATRHLIFWSLLTIAISLTGIRLVLMGVESYKSTLESRISALVGAPVKLGSLGAKMRGISPELILKDINIASFLTTEKPGIELKEIRLGINLGEFLLNRDVLSSSWVTLVGARLSAYRKQDGTFGVEGLKATNGQPLWLLQGRKYEVLQSKITWQDHQIGGAPIVLEPVNMAIMNDGSHHRINMLTDLPEQYGDDLKIVIDFEALADNFSDIKGTVYAEGKNIKVAEFIANYLPYEVSMKTGLASFKIWSQWQQAQLVSIKTDVQLRDAIFSRKGKGSFSLNDLDSQVNWQLNDRQWQLDINRFLLETGERSKKSSNKWPDAIVSVASEKTNDNGNEVQKIRLYAKQLDLGEAMKLSGFFTPFTDGQIQANGLLRNFSLYAETDIKSFAIAGWFDSIFIEPWHFLPGIENVSGVVKGSDKSGEVELTSHDVKYKAPTLFNKPLLFNQLNGVLAWQQTENSWVLSSQAIEVNSPAFNSVSRLFIDIPKSEEKPFIDLQTVFNSDDLSHIPAYLPTQIMKEKLKNWLSKAFVGGKLSVGNLLFYGRASDFPFTDNSGVFEAQLNLDKTEILFHPEWPHISAINGKLLFEQNKIAGLFNHGLIGKNDIDKAEMQISGLGVDEELTIKGEAHGEINQAISILEQSPLANRVTPLMSGINPQGTTKAMLELTIPLRPGHEIKVDGKAQLNNAQLTVNRIDLKIDKIKGDLKFNKQGIYGDSIQGVALNRPIKVKIAQADQQTLINVDGRAKVSEIETLFNWPGSNIIEGEGAYQLQLLIPKTDTDNNALQVNIKSTLEGVELHLPGTLSKTKDQKKPSSITFKLTDELSLPVELDYNHELKAAISLNSQDKIINSGHILVGTGDAVMSKSPGIKLEINRDQLALDDWLGMAATQAQLSASGFDLREIKIHSPSASWQKNRIGIFDLVVKHNPNGWSGEVDSSLAKGSFQIPFEMQGAVPVILNMGMLNLSALKQLTFQHTSTNSTFNPLLNIYSKKTLWQSVNLGQLKLETVRSPQGLTIKNLSLTGADEKLVLSGSWKHNGLKSSTYLVGQLNLKRADKVLDKLNITKDLTDTSGVINFDINWNGSPWQLTLPDIRGHIDANFNNGRILSIEPGFGRVLGILAVAQWIKRLQLDFSDIYEEGLTFNSIKGHFDLLNGKAKTDNLIIDAVPAKITITGDTDLVKQTVDHVIKVVPKSLDALPIAGTIFGRVAAMVGKTLTGKDQEGFFLGTQYLVKGSWEAAKISSLHENDGLFQKTWNSITDFPWTEEKQK